jgi:hypothetical protein
MPGETIIERLGGPRQRDPASAAVLDHQSNRNPNDNDHLTIERQLIPNFRRFNSPTAGHHPIMLGGHQGGARFDQVLLRIEHVERRALIAFGLLALAVEGDLSRPTPAWAGRIRDLTASNRPHVATIFAWVRSRAVSRSIRFCASVLWAWPINDSSASPRVGEASWILTSRRAASTLNAAPPTSG